MLRSVRATAIAALLASCAAPVYVDFHRLGAAPDPAALAELRAVRLESDPDAGDPLRDRLVGELAAAELAARGVALDPAAPVALIAHGFTVAEERWIPPETRVTHRWMPGRRRCYAIGSGADLSWVEVWEPGEWYPDVWTVPGRFVTDHEHHAEIVLQADGGAVLWMGELRAGSPSGDFRRVMQIGLPMLFREYPAPSGEPAEWRVELPAAR